MATTLNRESSYAINEESPRCDPLLKWEAWVTCGKPWVTQWKTLDDARVKIS